MKTITTDRTPDIPGYLLPGESATLVSELEGAKRLLDEQIRMAKQLHLDEIDQDSAANSMLQENEALQGKHDGETCFIIGGGPSLNGVEIPRLKEHTIFGLNAIFQHEECPELDYHVAADGNFFQPTNADGTSKAAYFERLFEVCEKTTFLTAFQFRKDIVAHGLLPMDRTRFLRFYPFALASGIDREIDLVSGIPATQNVAQFAILSAIGMGFRTIVLLGVDHDFPAGGNWTHSYDKPTAGPSNPLYQIHNGDLLWFTWQMWMGYQHIENYAVPRSIRIVNASARSNLDVFEYGGYQDFVSA